METEGQGPAMITQRERASHRLSRVRQERDGGEGERGEGQSTPYGALYYYEKKVLSS